MVKKDRVLHIHYGAIQGLYWSLAAVLFAFLTPILQERGFSNSEIGILLGVRSLATIFGQSMLSSLADKYRQRIPLNIFTGLIAVAGVAGSAVFWLLPMGFLPTCLLFLLLGATSFCISPMIDAIAMVYIRTGRELNYTLCRSVGSITWAAACIVLGYMMTAWGADSLIVFLMVFLFLLFLALILLKPQEQTQSVKKSGTGVHGIGWLLRNCPKYTVFVAAYLLSYMSSSFGNNFLIHIIQNLGGNSIQLGYAEFLLAIAEVPVVFFYVKLKKKIGLPKIMILFMFFGTVKIFCQSFAPSLCVFMLSQLLQMLGFGLSYSAIVDFVMETVPEADIVKGQGLLNVAGAGVGTCLASCLSGIIYDRCGLEILLSIAVVTGILSVAVTAAAVWEKKKVKKERSNFYGYKS